MAPIVIFWLTPCTLCRILIINQICVFLPKVSVFWRDLIFIILTHKLSLQNILYVVLDFVQILFWTFLVNISMNVSRDKVLFSKIEVLCPIILVDTCTIFHSYIMLVSKILGYSILSKNVSTGKAIFKLDLSYITRFQAMCDAFHVKFSKLLFRSKQTYNVHCKNKFKTG